MISQKSMICMRLLAVTTPNIDIVNSEITAKNHA
jgi:hypothetical protein